MVSKMRPKDKRKECITLRDPNRITKTLKAIEKFWMANPDWRLGQLIVNISRAAGGSDPFFLEDDKLLEILKGENGGGRKDADQT